MRPLLRAASASSGIAAPASMAPGDSTDGKQQMTWTVASSSRTADVALRTSQG